MRTTWRRRLTPKPRDAGLPAAGTPTHLGHGGLTCAGHKSARTAALPRCRPQRLRLPSPSVSGAAPATLVVTCRCRRQRRQRRRHGGGERGGRGALPLLRRQRRASTARGRSGERGGADAVPQLPRLGLFSGRARSTHTHTHTQHAASCCIMLGVQRTGHAATPRAQPDGFGAAIGRASVRARSSTARGSGWPGTTT